MSKRRRSSSVSGAPIAKHRLGYDPNWAETFPSVVPVHEESESDSSSTTTGLLCSLCRRHRTHQRNRSGTWTEKACTYLRKDMLERHEKSEMHMEARERERARIASQRSGGIRQAFSQQVVVQRKALIGALKMVYWLAKEEVAHTTKFASLMQLSINLGADYLRELHVGRNACYTSEQIIGELLQCLSQVIEEAVLSSMRGSTFYALMTDESTDIAVLKQLVLLGRCVSATEGVKTSYLCIVDIADGKAESTLAAILHFLDDKLLNIAKLRGFGSNGAAVMTDRLSGVSTRLKAHAPRLIAIHCVNHRLALAAAHAADHIPYMKRFTTNIHSLFWFYQNSSVRLAGLRAIQDVLNDPQIKCKEAKDVRWLSHGNAIKAIVRTLPSLLTSLEREAAERGNPTANGLLKFAKTYQFVACTLLLADILPHLNRLSLIFQNQSVDLALIKPCVEAAKQSIEQYRDHLGPHMTTIESTITSDLKDFNIPITDSAKENFKTQVQVKYIEAVVNGLQDKFPNTPELEAFGIFDPQKCPSSEDELTDYGQGKLRLLQEKYGAGDSPDIYRQRRLCK